MYRVINNVGIESIISIVPKKKVKLDKNSSNEQLLRVSRVIGVEESYKSENTTTVELFEQAAKVIIKKK